MKTASLRVLTTSLRVLAASPRVLTASLMVLAASLTVLAQPAVELRTKFEQQLAQIAAHVDGSVGYELVDLTSGDRFAHLERQTFPTASSIKLAIVYELFKQSEEHRIRLDETIVLDRSKAVGGSGVLVHLGTPTLSIRDYATLMVTLSDNTATNVLIDRLGMPAVNSRMESLGLGATKLRRHMMDTAAARRGDENVSTPHDLVELLKALSGGTTGHDGAAGGLPAAIDLLKLPKESRLRRGLPAVVPVADKPGELEGVRVDAGIVFAKDRPYVFAVMTTFLKDEVEGEHAIEEMSRVAYDYFSRLGGGGTLGRRIPKPHE
jgi:beta-lactamase class A